MINNPTSNDKNRVLESEEILKEKGYNVTQKMLQLTVSSLYLHSF